MLGEEVDMQKIRPAMERLNAALDRLEKHQKKSAANGGDLIGKQAEADALAMQCAHLRAEVSGLKKKKAELEAKREAKKAADLKSGK